MKKLNKPKYCNSCRCDISDLHGNCLYCKKCQPIIRKEKRADKIKMGIKEKRNKRLAIKRSAYKLISGDNDFRSEVLKRIRRAICMGSISISMNWLISDIRQLTDYKIDNSCMPYFVDYICKHYPEYKKYFGRK